MVEVKVVIVELLFEVVVVIVVEVVGVENSVWQQSS